MAHEMVPSVEGFDHAFEPLPNSYDLLRSGVLLDPIGEHGDHHDVSFGVAKLRNKTVERWATVATS